MRNLIISVALLLFATTMFAQENDWMVQIAVYNKQVPLFHFQDIDGKIFYSKDGYGFHRYFTGYFTEAEARSKSEALDKAGYAPTLMKLGEFDERCSCYKTPPPREITSSLRSIFFDFDKYNLRSESRKQLKILIQNLNENPSFTTRLQAHTDAKGSNNYNDSLSKKRANAAKNYLISKGIPPNRIRIDTYGENNPIAKNKLTDGSDTEEGRQFNRRVEIQLLDGNDNPIGIVESIHVPPSLQSDN